MPGEQCQPWSPPWSEDLKAAPKDVPILLVVKILGPLSRFEERVYVDIGYWSTRRRTFRPTRADQTYRQMNRRVLAWAPLPELPP